MASLSRMNFTVASAKEFVVKLDFISQPKVIRSEHEIHVMFMRMLREVKEPAEFCMNGKWIERVNCAQADDYSVQFALWLTGVLDGITWTTYPRFRWSFNSLEIMHLAEKSDTIVDAALRGKLTGAKNVAETR